MILGYKPEKGNNTFPDLVEFSETHLKAYEPLSGSDFIKIFGDSTFEERGLYDRMNNLISTEESEELIRISSQNSTKKIITQYTFILVFFVLFFTNSHSLTNDY
jgi:hypothetical protein